MCGKSWLSSRVRIGSVNVYAVQYKIVYKGSKSKYSSFQHKLTLLQHYNSITVLLPLNIKLARAANIYSSATCIIGSWAWQWSMKVAIL